MRTLLAAITALFLTFGLSFGTLLAQATQIDPPGLEQVCPNEGKVESVVDGDLDNIVLYAGTEVCIKGGQTLVNVIADGTSTLAELLGTGQNVSHYTEVLSSTTTTIPSTTSSTEAPTTTMFEATTTTVAVTTTVLDPTTTLDATTSSSFSILTSTESTLPFTGPRESYASLGLAGALLMLLGGLVLRSVKVTNASTE